MDKKRIVKDYDALPDEIIERVKVEYPYGFEDNLITFTNREGKKVSALPFETEEIYYLIRMTVMEARQIIEEDEDYDDDGTLRSDFSGGDEFASDEDVEESDSDDDDDY
uniref:DNA primase n=1 Tax=Roseihalotalea indica TaxID=2867963 RepID=A0AA49JIG2_9BACT|nr:hypothetical protein K4G66_21235 [Tunicatimonas sp. TK19036]